MWLSTRSATHWHRLKANQLAFGLQKANTRAGCVVLWLSMIASGETPTYGVKRLFGSFIWPDSAGEPWLLRSYDYKRRANRVIMCIVIQLVLLSVTCMVSLVSFPGCQISAFCRAPRCLIHIHKIPFSTWFWRYVKHMLGRLSGHQTQALCVCMYVWDRGAWHNSGGIWWPAMRTCCSGTHSIESHNSLEIF